MPPLLDSLRLSRHVRSARPVATVTELLLLQVEALLCSQACGYERAGVVVIVAEGSIMIYYLIVDSPKIEGKNLATQV